MSFGLVVAGVVMVELGRVFRFGYWLPRRGLLAMTEGGGPGGG